MHDCGLENCSHSRLSRRGLLQLGASCGAAIMLSGVEALAKPIGPAVTVSPEAAKHPLTSYSRRARRLMDRSHVVDMLCNVRHRLVVKGEENSLAKASERYLRWFKDPSSVSAAELQRYYDSGIDTFYCGSDLGQLMPGKAAFDRAVSLFESWKRIIAAHPETFMAIISPADLRRSHNSGKISMIFGLQNGDHFRSAEDVAFFYGLGQRVSQLTYNQANKLGGGAFSDVGITPFGREIVQAMNRTGMVVDLSHANEATARGAIEASKVTPIISHTNCRALNPGFSRALPDDVIKGVAERGGVIGVTVLRQFVSQEEPTTIDHFVRHIDHIVDIAGIKHVGIGSDSDLLPFDGVDDEARRKFFASSGQEQYKWRERLDIDGLDHPRRMYDIADALIKRGYRDRDISRVLGGNWVRVLEKIWTTRA